MTDNELTKMLESLAQTAKIAADHGISGDNEIETFKQLAFRLCKVEVATKQHRKALTKASQETTVEAFDETYAANIKSIPNIAVTKLANYEAFQRQLNIFTQSAAIQEDHAVETTIVDGELQMSDHIPDIDPITKRPIEKPCRNTQCGHIYDMDSMMVSLQTNSRMRCPIVGCVNKNRIAIADLVLDSDLARKLHLQRARQHRQT